MIPLDQRLARFPRNRILLLGCLIVALLWFHPPPSMEIYGSTYSSNAIPVTVTATTTATNLSQTFDQDTKYILFYTTYWNQPDFQFGTGRQPFLDYQCPVDNCWTQYSSADHSPTNRNFSHFDAVLFSVQAQDRFDVNDVGTDIQSWRKPHQRFVFFIMESQVYSIHNFRAMNGFFNWTMTFRWDSDIPRPYGWFEELSKTTGTGTVQTTDVEFEA